ncbi:hypothetical protein MTR_6g078865 [Medicago truncatula]|uniref:Uncharacterized protein n=1 Tax=Medicago truncatula TaxID=3880 RepID=A0A072UCX1_MEDTR|nr:hypothetical protein MTR_6g078865 [Medicago truncatula]
MDSTFWNGNPKSTSACHDYGETTQRTMAGNLLRNQNEIDNPAKPWWSNHSGIFAHGKRNRVFPASCNSYYSNN